MGTFTGHLVPGLAFALLGLWHTLNTIRCYKLRGPSGFISRTWYPLTSHLSILKYLELLLLFSFSALAMAMQLLELPVLRLSYTPDGLEHATMFFHVAIYASAALLGDLQRPSAPLGALRVLMGVLAANVFAQELFLLHFHSTDHVGIEGHYHWLLQVIVSVSLLSTVATAGVPGSFAAALVRSMSVIFQGVWFMVMGFALWVPRLVPEGCYATAPGGDGGAGGAFTCGTVEADARARVLGNLQFSWVLAGISIFTASLCLKHGGDGMEYRQLVAGGVDAQLGPAREEDLKQVRV